MAKKTRKPKSPTPKSTKPKEPFPIHYIKSDGFRISHADGAMLAVTQHGLINVNFWMSRPVIPQIQLFEVDDDNKINLSTPMSASGKTGAARQVDTGVILSPRMARTIAKLLIEKADEADAIAEASNMKKSRTKKPKSGAKKKPKKSKS